MNNKLFKFNVLNTNLIKNLIFLKRLNHPHIYKPLLSINEDHEIEFLNKPNENILQDEECEDVLKYLEKEGVRYNHPIEKQITEFSSCVIFGVKHIKYGVAEKHIRVLEYFFNRWVNIGFQASFFRYVCGLHQYYVNFIESLEGKDHVHYCACFFSLIMAFFYDTDISIKTIIEVFNLECSIEEMKSIYIRIFRLTDFDLLYEHDFLPQIRREDIYKIIEEIGRGAYGGVFKVYKDQKYYAMKIGRLGNEIDMLKSISSIYVPRVHDYGKKWMVMDIKKETLRQYRPRNLNKIIEQLLKGLSDIHVNNIVHMDIKPSNILVDDNENISFIDFGISLKIGDEVELGSTIWYRAPELLGKEKIQANTKMDIWSLGCVIYELLMGIPLFKAGNENKLIKKILKHKAFENFIYCDLLNDMITSDRLSADQLLKKYF